MFKIVAERYKTSAEAEKAFLVVDNQNGFTWQTASTLRQLFGMLKKGSRIEVGSLYNWGTVSLYANRCINKINGSLTLNGNNPMIVAGYLNDVITSSGTIKINGVDLGKAIAVPLTVTPQQMTRFGLYAKHLMDVVAIYLPKIDFLGFLPFDARFENLKQCIPCVQNWLNILCSGAYFFKLCYKATFTSRYMGVDEVSNFSYGMVYNNKISLVDLYDNELPLSRFINALERRNIVNTPLLYNNGKMLYGKDYGKGAYKCYDEVYAGDMFGVELIDGIRKCEGINKKLLGNGVYEWYDVSHQGNGYHIVGYQDEYGTGIPVLEGSLIVKNGKPELVIDYIEKAM